MANGWLTLLPKAIFIISLSGTCQPVFHWILVLLVAVSFVTGKLGGIAMYYHERSSVCILVLLLFRVVWGFVGGQQAHFVSFVRGPEQVVHYARSFLIPNAKPYLGHNPLGGWSILAMLAVLFLHAFSSLLPTMTN